MSQQPTISKFQCRGGTMHLQPKRPVIIPKGLLKENTETAINIPKNLTPDVPIYVVPTKKGPHIARVLPSFGDDLSTTFTKRGGKGSSWTNTDEEGNRKVIILKQALDPSKDNVIYIPKNVNPRAPLLISGARAAGGPLVAQVLPNFMDRLSSGSGETPGDLSAEPRECLFDYKQKKLAEKEMARKAKQLGLNSLSASEQVKQQEQEDRQKQVERMKQQQLRIAQQHTQQQQMQHQQQEVSQQQRQQQRQYIQQPQQQKQEPQYQPQYEGEGQQRKIEKQQCDPQCQQQEQRPPQEQEERMKQYQARVEQQQFQQHLLQMYPQESRRQQEETCYPCDPTVSAAQAYRGAQQQVQQYGGGYPDEVCMAISRAKEAIEQRKNEDQYYRNYNYRYGEQTYQTNTNQKECKGYGGAACTLENKYKNYNLQPEQCQKNEEVRDPNTLCSGREYQLAEGDDGGYYYGDGEIGGNEDVGEDDQLYGYDQEQGDYYDAQDEQQYDNFVCAGPEDPNDPQLYYAKYQSIAQYDDGPRQTSRMEVTTPQGIGEEQFRRVLEASNQ